MTQNDIPLSLVSPKESPSAIAEVATDYTEECSRDEKNINHDVFNELALFVVSEETDAGGKKIRFCSVSI